MPENSIPKEAAYQIINDELMLDGNPRLNLASFVTTWMEPECDKLMMAAINKNYVDMDEYPVTTELQVIFLFTRIYSLKKKIAMSFWTLTSKLKPFWDGVGSEIRSYSDHSFSISGN